jgi:hypothetical protein
MMDVAEALADRAPREALLHLSIGRDDSDSYSIALEKCAALGVGHPAVAALTAVDLMNLLPTGGVFRHVVGWRSIFGSPFRCGLLSLVALGVEQIVPHATRGAFPCSSVYVYADMSSALGTLGALLSVLPAPDSNSLDRYDVYSTNSATPDEHRFEEASTLTCAFHHWRKGHRFLFRTLLVNESALRLPGHPGPRWRAAPARGSQFDAATWLLLTTPSVRKELSSAIGFWMWANKWRTPDRLT